MYNFGKIADRLIFILNVYRLLTDWTLIVFGIRSGTFGDHFHARRLFVLVKIGFESESFAATLARERLQIGMSLDVGSQVGFVSKRFLTDLTGERLLACMGSYVAL